MTYHHQNFQSIPLIDETYEELKAKIYKNDEKYLYLTSNETISQFQCK